MKIGMKMKHMSKLFLRGTFIYLALTWTLFLFSSANAEHAGITLPKIEKEFVIERAKLKCVEGVDTNDSTRRASSPGCLLQMVSKNYAEIRTADIYAIKDHKELAWPTNEPVWSGLSFSSGIDVIRVSTNNPNKEDNEEYAAVSNKTDFATIEIINGKIYELTIYGDTFQKIKDVLITVAGKVGGSESDVTSSVVSNWTYHKVDKTRSPYCDTTYELSAGGEFELSHKFYIPSLSIDFPYIKVGVFAEPALCATFDGIKIELDGSKNPRQFTELSGGAKLEGSVSAGAGAEIEDPWEVLSVELDVKGTVSASGDFALTIPGPKLAGNYALGKLTASGTVLIVYRDTRIIDEMITQPIWDGISGTSCVDLSSLFSGK